MVSKSVALRSSEPPKCSVTVFRDSEGVMLVNFLEDRKTVTGAYYVQILKKLRSIGQKAPMTAPPWDSLSS